MQSIEIKQAGKKIYDIILNNTYDDLPNYLQSLGAIGRRICIVTDSNVAPLYLQEIQSLCQKVSSNVVHFIFEAGESNKNLSIIDKIYEKLILEKFDRNDYLIALGGGVTGDMTGFAAATYLRGIKFIQLPTTLLAQVDSSIGGKTGVDFKQYKNMVGAFHQPSLVYMNLKTLNTLDQRQFNAGMAEVIKHGLIKSLPYFNWIKSEAKHIQDMEYTALEHMIYESCQIKGAVVERDPNEKGERALLNYGHTVGHAVEKLKNFEWLHGECVALGSIAAAYISLDQGYLTESEYHAILSLFKRFDLPATVTGIHPEDVLLTTKSDKKMDGGHIKFILLKHIGEAFIETNLNEQEILNGIGECMA